MFIIGYCSQCDNAKWETFISRIWKYQVGRWNDQFKRRNEQTYKGGKWHDPTQRKYSWTTREAPWCKGGMLHWNPEDGS